MLSQTVKELEKTARQIRRDIITMIYQAGMVIPARACRARIWSLRSTSLS